MTAARAGYVALAVTVAAVFLTAPVWLGWALMLWEATR